MDARIQKLLYLPNYIKVIALFLALALFGCIFYFWFYQDLNKEHQNLKKRGKRLENTLAEKQEIANNLDKYKAEYEILEVQLNQSLKELPRKKEIPGLLTTIADLAKKQGLEVLLFKPVKERPRDFYAEVPVQIKLLGNYHQVAQFFDAVGKMDRIVNIGNVRLSRKNTSGQEAILNVACNATTYRFIDQPKNEGKKKRGRR